MPAQGLQQADALGLFRLPQAHQCLPRRSQLAPRVQHLKLAAAAEGLAALDQWQAELGGHLAEGGLQRGLVAGKRGALRGAGGL